LTAGNSSASTGSAERADLYISADVETDGPVPGKYSMLSFGLVVVGSFDGAAFTSRGTTGETFYRELQPISPDYEDDALKVNKLDRARLLVEGVPPATAMCDAFDWVETVASGYRPVLVGYPLAFDWTFLYWYFMTYCDRGSPFGFSSCLDIRTMLVVMRVVPLSRATKRYLPVELQPSTAHTHHALGDAQEQGELFTSLFSLLRPVTGVLGDPSPSLMVKFVEPALLGPRRSDSNGRLSALCRSLSEQLVTMASSLENTCIYATGSYGRQEASSTSDIDIFMIDAGAPEAPLANITQIELKAKLIAICRERGYPEFSRDGEFLEMHPLEQLTSRVGSQDEDAENLFTARLLLLLESRPLYNEACYDRVVQDAVAAYFPDFFRHEADFRPVFLINDIVRYWKTLCLNYEHRRKPGLDNPAEAKLKNLKLGFSRVMTCYSMIVGVVHQYAQTGCTSPQNVIDLVRASPTERLTSVAIEDPAVRPAVSGVLTEYCWFLETLGGERPAVVEWLRVPANKDEAEARAEAYLNHYYHLLTEAAGNSTIRRFLSI
jgi:hypothetical protein